MQNQNQENQENQDKIIYEKKIIGTIPSSAFNQSNVSQEMGQQQQFPPVFINQGQTIPQSGMMNPVCTHQNVGTSGCNICGTSMNQGMTFPPIIIPPEQTMNVGQGQMMNPSSTSTEIPLRETEKHRHHIPHPNLMHYHHRYDKDRKVDTIPKTGTNPTGENTGTQTGNW